jgi:hypothetical protein
LSGIYDKLKRNEFMKLKEVIVNVNVKDLEYIDQLPCFQPLYEYFPEEEGVPQEWGRIKTEEAILKFYAYSE